MMILRENLQDEKCKVVALSGMIQSQTIANPLHQEEVNNIMNGK